MDATALAPFAAIETLSEIALVAAFCCPTEAAIEKVWLLISFMRPVIRRKASIAPLADR